ncbi:MAG: flagellar biosynthetic protein FliO [Myxococcota bacterium]
MLTLTALLLLATTPATAEGSAKAPPAPPTAADSVVAAAFGKDVGTKGVELKAETNASPGWSNLAAPALALAGLAALALTLRRRKQLQSGSIHIIEATSLGEKRSLVIADVLGERLVLGVSEAGITVLMNKPAPEGEPAPITLPPSLSPPVTKPMGFWARLKGRNATPAFDAALQESIEDQELRAKLAAGKRGVVT